MKSAVSVPEEKQRLGIWSERFGRNREQGFDGEEKERVG